MPSSFSREDYQEIAYNKLWIKSVPFRFIGLEIGIRMTIVRLDKNDLFVHSPIPLDPLTKTMLYDLGQVKYVISPNNLHHLFLSEYVKDFPYAKFYASPGLVEKRKDIQFYSVLTEIPDPAWKDHLDQTIFVHPDLKEVVFFHRSSKTLIVADLLANFGHNSAFMTRLLSKMSGSLGEPTCNLNFRIGAHELYQVKLSLEKIMTWDFEVIILSHGQIITQNAKDVFKKVFSFILDVKM